MRQRQDKPTTRWTLDTPIGELSMAPFRRLATRHFAVDDDTPLKSRLLSEDAVSLTKGRAATEISSIMKQCAGNRHVNMPLTRPREKCGFAKAPVWTETTTSLNPLTLTDTARGGCKRPASTVTSLGWLNLVRPPADKHACQASRPAQATLKHP